MAPTCTRFGTSARNTPAALRAADRRDGATSWAAIEPDWSKTSSTRAWSIGTATVTCGRVSATTSVTSAST